MRAKSHTYSDFARATRDGISFDAVNADDCEPERKPSKDGEQRRTGADNPKLRIAVHVFLERSQLEYRQ